MTKHLMRGAMAGAAVCALCLGATKVSADEWNHKTIVTINQPMQVPGATLEPGTYILKLANDDGARNVVNIFAADNRTLIATANVIPMRRVNETHGGLALEVAMPSSSDMPMLKGWLYPGFGGGHEFVYPKAQERRMTHSETVEIPVAPR